MRSINTEKKLCLVCSSGGHLFQLYSLRPLWLNYARVWVSFSSVDANYLLKNEKVYRAHNPTNRNIKNMIKNSFLALRVLKIENPDVIISTGAGAAVPFLYIGRLLGKKTIYIESLTRVKALSLSGKLIYPIVDHFLVQWRDLEKRYKKVKFVGQLI